MENDKLPLALARNHGTIPDHAKNVNIFLLFTPERVFTADEDGDPDVDAEGNTDRYNLVLEIGDQYVPEKLVARLASVKGEVRAGIWEMDIDWDSDVFVLNETQDPMFDRPTPYAGEIDDQVRIGSGLLWLDDQARMQCMITESAMPFVKAWERN